MNYKSNFNTIAASSTINLVDSVENNLYTTNVPLGIWFFAEDTGERTIELFRDKNTGFAQTWSLVISSQFKPFPYSNNMPSDMQTNATTNAFTTFSQVLASQAEMVKTFNKLTQSFEAINQRMTNIEFQLANIGTSYNIDSIHKEMIDYEIEMNNNYNTFKDTIISYIDGLRWKVNI